MSRHETFKSTPVKVFISQPMGGRSLTEILKERKEIINYLETVYEEEGVDVIDNISINKDYITNTMNHPGLWYFAESIKLMIGVDFVLFAKGWEDSAGCRLEREVTKVFGFKAFAIVDPNQTFEEL